MSRPDRQEHLHGDWGWCSLAAGNRGFCPGGIVKYAESVEVDTRWQVVRHKGWTTVTNQTSGVAFSTKDHARAIAWIRADRDERPDCPPARWKVTRREGWSTVTHPTGGVMLRTRNHEAATAYADRLAREEQ